MKTIIATIAALAAVPALAQMTPAPATPGQQPAEQAQQAYGERVDSEAKARAKLSEKGYSVERIERRPDGTFAATTMKDNERKQVVVHSDGRVTPAS
jgi:DNA-dependent RNA polymerase auxiliary subunit epsilon